MTGFGSGDAPLGEGRVVIEVRAINSRHLELRTRLPREFFDFAAFVETEARRRLGRGRVDIGVRAEGPVLPEPVLDRSRARAAYRALCELRDEVAPGSEVPFSTLASLPDLFTPLSATGTEAIQRALLAALTKALDALDRMRQTEGRALEDDLARRTAELRSLTARLASRAPSALDAHARKLRERIARLFARPDEPAGDTSPPALDATQIEREIVLFADRTDVSEEIVRIGSHLDQLDSSLGAPGPIGRKLDFLLQELAREINTVGAKSQDALMAHWVVEAKTEIERMREQVQNVE